VHIGDILKRQKTTVSFEFFPPKTPRGWNRLFRDIARLVPLNPSFVSVTYGAGGTTRQRTHDLVERIARQTGLTVAAHLTCLGSTRNEISQVMNRYSDIGIRNILALRGDPTHHDTGQKNHFTHAEDLVRFIRARFPEDHIGVAGYPEGHPDAPNRLAEITNLKRKVDAGADYIVTQLFFDNRDFYDFCERCFLAGIHVPIIAGIMPIISRDNMIKMADLAKRSRFPAGLLRALNRAQGTDCFERVGIHWAAEQVRDLIDHNVAGIHFFTLNHSNATLKVCETLGITDFSQITGASDPCTGNDTKADYS
jgi:methylenetetrahydrofolate reductase (NADPH)